MSLYLIGHVEQASNTSLSVLSTGSRFESIRQASSKSALKHIASSADPEKEVTLH